MMLKSIARMKRRKPLSSNSLSSCPTIIIILTIIGGLSLSFALEFDDETTTSTLSSTFNVHRHQRRSENERTKDDHVQTFNSTDTRSTLATTTTKSDNNDKNKNRAEQLLALDEARKRCEKFNETNDQQDENTGLRSSFCPRVWDGALCWPESPSNKMINQPCPKYVKGFNHNGQAYKNCTSSGVWYFNNETKRYWTDYSECVLNVYNETTSSSSSNYHGTMSSSMANVKKNTDNNHNDDEYDFGSSKLTKILHHLPNFQIISHIGYSISFISLVAAFFILVYVKRLRCPRNSLHLQLFISFIIRSSMYLIKTSLEQFPFDLNQLLNVLNSRATNTYDDGLMWWPINHQNNHENNNHTMPFNDVRSSSGDYDIATIIGHPTTPMTSTISSYGSHMLGPNHSPVVCKIFTTVWQYSLLANYNWIFMEGLYLHNVIFLNIFNDNSNIIPYIVLGWCLPIPIVTLWAMMRSFYEDTSCWTTNSNLKIFWIMRAPITIIIVLNFFFFVNIIRVLFLKMFAKSAATPARKYKYRTWFRSTLVLVPLFGVHYMFFLAFTTITFNSYDIFEIIWLYTDLTFTTFQGCLVALLYCFFNHEVQVELRKLWLSCKQSMLSSRHFFLPTNSSINGEGIGQQQTCSRNTRHSLISDCSSFFNKKENFTSSDGNYHHHPPHHHNAGIFDQYGPGTTRDHFNIGLLPGQSRPLYQQTTMVIPPPPPTAVIKVINDDDEQIVINEPDPVHQLIFGETTI